MATGVNLNARKIAKERIQRLHSCPSVIDAISYIHIEEVEMRMESLGSYWNQFHECQSKTEGSRQDEEEIDPVESKIKGETEDVYMLNLRKDTIHC